MISLFGMGRDQRCCHFVGLNKAAAHPKVLSTKEVSFSVIEFFKLSIEQVKISSLTFLTTSFTEHAFSRASIHINMYCKPIKLTAFIVRKFDCRTIISLYRTMYYSCLTIVSCAAQQIMEQNMTGSAITFVCLTIATQ